MDRVFRVPRFLGPNARRRKGGWVVCSAILRTLCRFQPFFAGEDDGGIYGQSGGVRRLKSHHARHGGKDIRAGASVDKKDLSRISLNRIMQLDQAQQTQLSPLPSGG